MPSEENMIIETETDADKLNETGACINMAEEQKLFRLVREYDRLIIIQKGPNFIYDDGRQMTHSEGEKIMQLIGGL
jgi:hypothetical protein